MRRAAIALVGASLAGVATCAAQTGTQAPVAEELVLRWAAAQMVLLEAEAIRGDRAINHVRALAGLPPLPRPGGGYHAICRPGGTVRGAGAPTGAGRCDRAPGAAAGR